MLSRLYFSGLILSALIVNTAWPARADTATTEQGELPFSERPRVIGGEPSQDGQWPWQVALLKQFEGGGELQICGGSLIASRWVLTAAHCLRRTEPDQITVSMGSTQYLGPDAVHIKARQIIIHPHNDQAILLNDLALIELESTVPENDRIKPIRLATPAEQAELTRPGRAVVVSGWGKTETGEPSQVLRHAQLEIKPAQQCNDAHKAWLGEDLQHEVNLHKRFLQIPHQVFDDAMKALKAAAVGPIRPDNLCASAANNTKTACNGDSGGPLVANAQTGYVQVGVVSWGHFYQCDLPGIWGVYTMPAAHYDWIRKVADLP